VNLYNQEEKDIMINRGFYSAVPVLLSLIFALEPPAFARGDKVIPQVADGSDIHTKFDLINVSSRQPIANGQLRFLHQDGSAWSLNIRMGNTLLTGSSFTLSLVPRQTLRVETLGASSPTTSGYALIEDNEPLTSNSPQDIALGISVYYEVYSGGGVVDTVSVPVGDPTALGTFPVEIDESRNLSTGFAIVNRAPASNNVTINLFSADSTPSGSATFAMNSGQQRAEFLDQRIFPGLSSFKGMAEFVSDGPVAILALLQTQTSNGVQYATLVPVNKESLRPNTYIILPQAQSINYPQMPLDIDTLTVDFYRLKDPSTHEDYSWDLAYEYSNSDITARYLKAYNGAAIAPLAGDFSNPDTFDAVSLPFLKSVSYPTAVIDLSDRSGNLKSGFAFAVSSDEGNYAKLRIVSVIDTVDASGNHYKDLYLEAYVFK
jgi:hypothetical protein